MLQNQIKTYSRLVLHSIAFIIRPRYPLSNMALFAGFLMLWLKRCAVSSAPKEALSVNAVYSVAFLAFGHPLGLLPAMTCDI